MERLRNQSVPARGNPQRPLPPAIRVRDFAPADGERLVGSREQRLADARPLLRDRGVAVVAAHAIPARCSAVVPDARLRHPHVSPGYARCHPLARFVSARELPSLCRRRDRPSRRSRGLPPISRHGGPLRGGRLSRLVQQTHGPHLLSDVPPFLGGPSQPVLWPRLTSAGSAVPFESGYRLRRRIRQISPGKREDLPPAPAPLTAPPRGSCGVCCVVPTHPSATASYRVHVLRAVSLPRASARSCLAAGTLAFG